MTTSSRRRTTIRRISISSHLRQHNAAKSVKNGSLRGAEGCPFSSVRSLPAGDRQVRERRVSAPRDPVDGHPGRLSCLRARRTNLSPDGDS